MKLSFGNQLSEKYTISEMSTFIGWSYGKIYCKVLSLSPINDSSELLYIGWKPVLVQNVGNFSMPDENIIM